MLVLPVTLLLFAVEALAVKKHDFKTCAQSGFCRRGRALAERAKESSATWKSPYSIDPSSIAISPEKSSFTASVLSSIYPDIKFQLEVRAHDDGVFRVRMDEVDGLRKRYDEAASWALIAEPKLSSSIAWTQSKKEVKAVNGKVELRVTLEPLKVALLRNGKEEIVLNGNGLLHMEHFRLKTPKESTVDAPPPHDEQVVLEGSSEEQKESEPVAKASAWFEGEGEDAWWEEQWISWKDSKPKGPESLSLDISFPTHGHLYGLPEHATPLDLPETTGENAKYTDPYRLYNLDVFEYEVDTPMSLYGAVPLVHAHSKHSTVGVFNAVGSETWVDVSHPTKSSTKTHWISESGILDVFLLPGSTPEDVFHQYARLTGTAPLPRDFSIAYHQCRWNYLTSDDIREVQANFDKADIPFDVLWLDIEYAPDHQYFIWDEKKFPDPVDMFNDVSAIGRKMVVIIDPHFKRSKTYPVYKSASEKGLLIKNANDGEFDGWCWSGSSSWVDYFNPASWDWWKGLFKLDGNNGEWHWKDSTKDVFIWNDMNEPSVFNGPEITMPKDNVHYGGWEHRDVHNINGMLFHNSTAQAVKYRTETPTRPFVLSRAFYAGSQRFGAIWTGDNMGTWEHMAIGIPMVLSNGVAGITFSGAVVGGFFGNPDSEMLTRWYQVGIFAPFFRAHAHIDTKRREPFLLEEPYKSIVRDIIKLRYTQLPIWYTAFHRSSLTGIPVLRPQYVMFPQDTNGFSIDDQYYIGDSGLLVKPIAAPGVKETTIYLAEQRPYYNYFDYTIYQGKSSGKDVTVPAELHQIPLFIRGGSIVPTRERPRRSSALMKKDPFTLRVALDFNNDATGELYLDDGETYLYQEGQFIRKMFKAHLVKRNRLLLEAIDISKKMDGIGNGDSVVVPTEGENAFAKSMESVRIEKIIILGLTKKPSYVSIEGVSPLEYDFTPGGAAYGGKDGETASILTIRDPSVKITDNWKIEIDS